MPEPITVIGASAVAAYLGKDGLNKLLGPTADYLGQEVRGFVEKCNINLDSVFRRALRKLGHRAELPGQVSPRVLKRVITDAPFCDDPVVQEYFAGMLASAREVLIYSHATPAREHPRDNCPTPSPTSP